MVVDYVCIYEHKISTMGWLWIDFFLKGQNIAHTQAGTRTHRGQDKQDNIDEELDNRVRRDNQRNG